MGKPDATGGDTRAVDEQTLGEPDTTTTTESVGAPAPEPGIAELRATAKKWELSAGGKKDAIANRIEKHEANVRAELDQHDETELRDLAVVHGVEGAAAMPGDGLVDALIDAGVAWHEGVVSSGDDGDGDGHRPTANPDLPDAERPVDPDPLDRPEDKPVVNPRGLGADELASDETVADAGDDADDAGVDDGTVWIDGFHVEVGSAAHEALLARGLQPGPPPKDAE